MSAQSMMSPQELESRLEKARSAFCRVHCAPASEVARQWGDIDVWALLALARRDANVLRDMTTYMLWGCCPVERDEDFFVAQRLLHARVLGYVEVSPRRLEWFASLMSSINPKSAFEAFSQQLTNFDFDAFHAALARLLRAAGQASTAPDSIGGLSRDVYWPTAVYGLEGQLAFDPASQDWDYFDLYERRPQFWEAFCRFAVARGIGPDYPLQDRPPMAWYEHHQGDLNFVDTVARQLSEGCAEVFMAIHTEHSMRQTILATTSSQGAAVAPARTRAKRQTV